MARQDQASAGDKVPLDLFMTDFLPDGEAIERAPLPPLARSVLYVLATLLTLGVLWAWWAEVDRVVTAPGRLVTTAPTVVVQPLETAVIRAIDVRVGDRVQAGQRLATLDPTFAAADLADLSSRLSAAQAHVARLQAEHDGVVFTAGDNLDRVVQASILQRRRAEYAARLSGYEDQMNRLTASLTTSEATREGLSRRVSVVEEIETVRNHLYKKQTGSLLQLLEARNERLRLSGEQEDLLNREREIRFELSRAKAERDAFVDEWRRKITEELVEKTRELSSLVEQETKARRRASLIALTAPVDAVVLEAAQRSVGSVAREAEPLFTLVPADVPLEAEVEIPSADVGLVRLDDPVRLKLDAFPYQRHGIMDGTLRTVSADAFVRDSAKGGIGNGGTAGGAASGGPAVFRARIRLLSDAPAQAPAGTRVSPGMTGAAEIIVGRRSVLSYLLYPVIRAFDESIREP